MTDSVTIYHIPAKHVVNQLDSKQRKCINIIDTPGFGDTRGPNADKRIFKMIAALFNSLVTLDYILMVVKSSENRLPTSSQYVFQNIQNLYGKDV